MASKQCPTSFSSMISAPRTSTTPHTLPQESTEQSQTSSCSNEDGPDTSFLSGDSTTHKSTGHHTSMPIKSQSTWKDDSESESSSDSPSSDNKATFLSKNKDKTCKRPATTTGAKKKMKKTVVPTEIHLLIRAAADACGNWEKELESVHGLSESEACTCVNLVGEYLNKDSFPDFDGGKYEEKMVRLAEQGRVLMKRLDELLKKYPQESSEQICRADGWCMLQEQ
ncbi:hypothetical protein IV203_017944 [Nitzschia inconspicua]|uniref:Uncharacterized protein n=1 Tax=Nitzschia inconspicua TaxID=303405 RepID=A0A9K3Q555_9STRA|nr:hypothetical protein IV203_017944 [Nitzschia inconspicua]